MKIREATPDDVEAISRLAQSLSEKYVIREFPVAARDALLKSMTAAGIRKHIEAGCRYHVADDAGTVIGVVGIKNNEHVYHLFVDEAFQRRGIARQLWEVAMHCCMAAGNPGRFTVNSSRYAQSVYESFGFVAQSEPRERNGIVTIPMQLVVGS